MARRLTYLCLLFLPALAAILFGCSGDDSTSPVNEPVLPLVSGDIDASGGELIHDDVVLTVPGGALGQSADLAVYTVSGDHPFGEDGAPAYRISGLPSDLGAPVTLRFRHGLVLAAGDDLTCFLGEDREAYSGGSGPSWHRIAGRDSAGWAIVEMQRGALDLGTKETGDVQAAATSQWEWVISDAEHFEVGYNPSEVSEDRATEVLSQFDQMYDAYVTWGFEFGDIEEIWPLDVNIRTPIKSTACYVTAPYGAGYFEIDPSYLAPGEEVLPVIAHEMFHCVQTFYDPRDPEEWGVLNQERMWLDEATASYIEVFTAESDDAIPEGMDDENYATLLSGIAGHSYLENNVYGYGMVQFIIYLVEYANQEDGQEFILQLFQHFKTGGDVTDAIDAVITPPVSSWCVDMHRKLAENQFFPTYLVYWFWHQWGIDGYLEGDLGATETDQITVPDLGADICKILLEGDDTDPLTQLLIETRRADLSLPAEELHLSIYGRALNSALAHLGNGVDNVLIPDWPTIHATYEEVYVMVSRPYSTAPGHTGSREIVVKATVSPDLSSLDVTTFNGVSIEVRTDNRYNNMTMVYPNELVGISADVSWTGGGLHVATPRDTFSIAINPETWVLGNWYGAEHYTSIGGNWIVKRLGGRGGLALESWDENSVIFRVSGIETCDYLTHVYSSYASDSETSPYHYLLDYSCSEGGEFPWERSGIYVHLYRVP